MYYRKAQIKPARQEQMSVQLGYLSTIGEYDPGQSISTL